MERTHVWHVDGIELQPPVSASVVGNNVSAVGDAVPSLTIDDVVSEWAVGDAVFFANAELSNELGAQQPCQVTSSHV